jgi:uncharacterized protein YcaQ
MARAREGRDTYAGLARFGRENRALIARTLAEVRERGPLRAADVSDHRPTGEAWWGWSPVKSALEWLFWTGDLMTAQRRNFERVYDLAERVLPPAIIAAPTPSPEEAQRALLRIAARALGIATASDLRDYFRLPVADTRARIAELVEDGDLEPVTVEGWKQDAYLAAGARIPRTIDACALLSPFDSLIWERARTERLFDFVYRLEIYTPKHKRRHGYYVLPFLFGDRLAARADCKADRAEGKLRVLAVHYEDARPSAALRAALADELAQLAAWLDLAPPPRRLPVLSQ